ncbi:hypothetical protein FGB62_61g168 [Gracilaria domingensis]|nr:hypothetical protein FGB62_61g168 [Gracilaria domingensis]
MRSTRACGCSVYDMFSHCKRFPAMVLHSYAHLIGQPIRESPMGTPSFHRSAWVVLGITTGLFLLTLYQASLTVLLFESKKSSPFRTLDDIVQCSIKPNRVAMLRGGASQDFWNKIVNTSFNRDNCKWDPQDDVGITVSDLEQGFRFLTERKADFFYSLRGSIVFRAAINCREYVPVGVPFFSTSVAFVLPQTTNQTIRHHLDNTTRFLREEDPFPTADALARANSCGDEIEATITLEKLMAFSIMYVATWLFLVAYRCVFLWRRRRKQQQQRLERQSSHAYVPKYPDGVIVDMSEISMSNSNAQHGTDDDDNLSEPTSGSLMNIDRFDHVPSR